MEKYLTAKAHPAKWQVLLENAAVLAMCALLLAWLYVGVYGWEAEGISVAHGILLALIAGLIVLLNLLTERKRARMHALLIVRALLASPDGRIPLKKLEKDSGLRRAADTVNRLVEKGYLQQVVIRREDVCLAECVPEEAPQEEVKPIFRN